MNRRLWTLLSSQSDRRSHSPLPFGEIALLAGCLLTLSGCDFLPKDQAKAQQRPAGLERQQHPAVDVAIARPGSLQEALEYTGTTQPIQEVTVRSQSEGQLLQLTVDVGDPVRQGQSIAQIDDTLPQAEVNEATAELSARKLEVARAQTQINEAQARVELAKAELEQAEADAARLQKLYQQGAIAKQQAEQALTKARTSQQLLRSAQEQVRTQNKVVAAAQERVSVQQAVIAQAKERRSYNELTSPLSGIILQRLTEPGNLLRPGDELLKIGDFSRIKVAVPVSELELSKVRVGQPVQVRLDAFPEQSFSGSVTRISPAADPQARLIPVELAIPNTNGRLGSGLLARVSFATENRESILVPASAFGKDSPKAGRQAQLFLVTGEGKQAKVQARSVTLGQSRDGKVEILAGLEPGEKFVANSSKPLKDGDTVRLSILSER